MALSDEKKAVVLAALLTGQGVNQIADKYKIPKSTVSRLKSKIPQEQLEQIGTQKADQLANLIAQNLEASFKARDNILRQTENADWLNKQSASELATLYGVAYDKDLRILEAIENAKTVESESEWPEVVRS
jgi:transposase